MTYKGKHGKGRSTGQSRTAKVGLLEQIRRASANRKAGVNKRRKSK